MPEIPRFYGIVIKMYFGDHAPPHFHAEYQGQQGKFGFDGVMTVGNIRSRTALRLIREWAELRRAELEANWERARARTPLDRIAPLE